MSSPDKVRLRHMLDAARDALDFSAGKSIQIIGEAAVHVPEETRKHYPEIRWTDIIGMRNRLVHSYYRNRLGYCLENRQ